MLETSRNIGTIRAMKPELKLLLYMLMFVVIFRTRLEIVLITCNVTSSSAPSCAWAAASLPC